MSSNRDDDLLRGIKKERVKMDILDVTSKGLPFLGKNMSAKTLRALTIFGYIAILDLCCAGTAKLFLPNSLDIFTNVLIFILAFIPIRFITIWIKEKFSFCTCEADNNNYWTDNDGKRHKAQLINIHCKLHGEKARQRDIAMGKPQGTRSEYPDTKDILKDLDGLYHRITNEIKIRKI
jgi:hypothetical protein